MHSVEQILKWNGLRLTGHLYKQFEPKNKIISFIVDGLTSQGRPRFIWKDMVNTDLYKKMF